MTYYEIKKVFSKKGSKVALIFIFIVISVVLSFIIGDNKYVNRKCPYAYSGYIRHIFYCFHVSSFRFKRKPLRHERVNIKFSFCRKIVTGSLFDYSIVQNKILCRTVFLCIFTTQNNSAGTKN